MPVEVDDIELKGIGIAANEKKQNNPDYPVATFSSWLLGVIFHPVSLLLAFFGLMIAVGILIIDSSSPSSSPDFILPNPPDFKKTAHTIDKTVIYWDRSRNVGIARDETNLYTFFGENKTFTSQPMTKITSIPSSPMPFASSGALSETFDFIAFYDADKSEVLVKRKGRTSNSWVNVPNYTTTIPSNTTVPFNGLCFAKFTDGAIRFGITTTTNTLTEVTFYDVTDKTADPISVVLSNSKHATDVVLNVHAASNDQVYIAWGPGPDSDTRDYYIQRYTCYPEKGTCEYTDALPEGPDNCVMGNYMWSDQNVLIVSVDDPIMHSSGLNSYERSSGKFLDEYQTPHGKYGLMRYGSFLSTKPYLFNILVSTIDPSGRIEPQLESIVIQYTFTQNKFATITQTIELGTFDELSSSCLSRDTNDKYFELFSNDGHVFAWSV